MHFFKSASLVALLLFIAASLVHSAPAPPFSSLTPQQEAKAVSIINGSPVLRAFCQIYLHGYHPATSTKVVSVTATSTVPATTTSTTLYTSTFTTDVATSVISVQGPPTTTTTLTTSTVTATATTTAVSRKRATTQDDFSNVDSMLAKRGLSCPSPLAPYKLLLKEICSDALYGMPKTTVTKTVATATQSSGTVTSTVDAVSTLSSTVPTTTTGAAANTQVVTSVIFSTSFLPAPKPSMAGYPMRIEGSVAEGTIYEGIIPTMPMMVTTASGGTHQCDGTNNGANANPGATLTDALASAAAQNNFPFDGTFSSQFQDFFITSIGQSTQTSNQFWGVLLNFVFTPGGGCQTEYGSTSDLGLWAFDAFNAMYFLALPLQNGDTYPTYTSGQTFSTTVTGYNGNGGGANPISGATVTLYDASQNVQSTQTSDANGGVTFTAPTAPGAYHLKASQSSAIRSNAFVIVVSG